MPKTIAMIGNTSWGMLQFRSSLMKELLQSGHKVVVIAPLDECSEEIRELGCKYINLPVERKGANPFKDLKYIFHLTKILLEEAPHCVLAYTIKPALYGSVASRLAGTPQIFAIMTGLGFIFSRNNLLTRFVKGMAKFCLRFATQVWFLNTDDANTFINAKLIPSAKSFVLPGEGVDTEHYCTFTEQSSQVTFTLISRMLWDKGVALFVETAKELKKVRPDLEFLLIGPVDDGNPEAIPLEQLIQWHDEGAVKYLGHMKDVRPILKRTSCLVHPTFYKEGLPRVLMEANAMGVPCITTDTSGCRDVIKDGVNGFLITPKCSNSLKSAVLKFLELDEEEKYNLGFKARYLMINNFSSNRINKIYTERLSLT